MSETLIAGGGETVNPWEVDQFHRRDTRETGKIGGKLLGAVGRPCVRENDLIDEVGDGFETWDDVLLLVLDNHCEGDASASGTLCRSGPYRHSCLADRFCRWQCNLASIVHPIASRSLTTPLFPEPVEVLLQLPSTVN